jgi:hypothetical protein
VESVDTSKFRFVVARLGYLGGLDEQPAYRIYPPASGRRSEGPRIEHHEVRVYDCRATVDQLDLDRHGFLVRSQTSATNDFYDEGHVRTNYYPEIEAVVKGATGAIAVFVFDHNVRSVEGAARGQTGVRPPVDGAHGDYTENSGERRIREVLEAHGRSDLGNHRVALINAWRPIRGPVQDKPLAICDARSVSPLDFVETDIEHFGEGDMTRPRHTGHIYSVRYNPEHRWYYLSDMQPHELLLFKCYDSQKEGVARFTPHTGFSNPECPAQFTPRQSIEARTIVIYPRH